MASDGHLRRVFEALKIRNDRAQATLESLSMIDSEDQKREEIHKPAVSLSAAERSRFDFGEGYSDMENEQHIARNIGIAASLGPVDPSAPLPTNPVVVLSLDAGGGTRTSKQLGMLRVLMEEISSDISDRGFNSFGHIVRPCDVFDLIVGNGTGGLISLLLGRLRMSLDEVSVFYSEMEERVFGPLTQMDVDKATQKTEESVLSPARAEAAAELEAAVTELVKSRNMGTALVGTGNHPKGRVLVAAIESGDGGNKISRFRSYTYPRFDNNNDLSIVEAVMATMADAEVFNPSKAKGMVPNPLFNPISLAREEAALLKSPKFGTGSTIFASVGTTYADKDEQTSAGLAGKPRSDKWTFDEAMDWQARECALAHDGFETEGVYNYFRINHNGNIDLVRPACQRAAKVNGNCIEDARELYQRQRECEYDRVEGGR